MKQCRQCRQFKSYPSFYKKSNKRSNLCKQCFNLNRKIWIDKNKSKYLRTRRAYYNKKRLRIRELSKINYQKHRHSRIAYNKHRYKTFREEILIKNKLRYKRDRCQILKLRKVRHIKLINYAHNYLKHHPCKNCGENNITVLEFHHVGSKIKDVSIMLQCVSLDTLIKEINKCEILCANCHRLKTAKDQRWYDMSMFRCSRCQQNKPRSAFGNKYNKINKWCKLCHSEYNHNRYIMTKEKWNDNRRKRRYVARTFVLDYLKTHPCKCGESKPEVLEFHHIKNKKCGIWQMLVQGRTNDSILKEIKKCQVLCANCHKKLTAKQQKWSKLL